MVKISEFARARGVEPDTVSQYMRRHGMDYDKEQGLTEEQQEELEKMYPSPSALEVVPVDPEKEKLREDLQDKEQELKEAYKKIMQLQDEKAALIEKASKVAFLEDLQEKKEQELKEKEQLILEKTGELEKLKHRGLWARILNKQ